MMLYTSGPTFRADFNSVDGQGRVKTMRGHAVSALVGEPAVGEVVWLVDDDENRCQAVIVEATPTILRLEPIWETWTTGLSMAPFRTRVPFISSHATQAASFPNQTKKKLQLA